MNISKQEKGWIGVTGLITLSIPLLYVIGRGFDEGYLKTYGLSPSLFERSTQDYLYFALTGMIQTIWTMVISLLNMWWFLLLCVIAAIIFENFRPSEPRFYKEKIKNFFLFFSKNISLKILGMGLGAVVFAGCYILIFVAFMGLLALPLVAGKNAGEITAETEIKQDKNICTSVSRKDLTACIKITKDNEQLLVGRVVAKSNDFVAIAENGQVTVLPIKDLSFETLSLKKQFNK